MSIKQKPDYERVDATIRKLILGLANQWYYRNGQLPELRDWEASMQIKYGARN